jgi:predicted metalloprotease with PDZ domain
MADVTIRKQTENRKGLRDALRGIVASGGTIDHDWPIEKVIAVGDRATGTSVLKTLYEEMGEKPKQVALDDLWNQLGVRVENGTLILDKAAPLARIRERITAADL